jgi:hypothetical protein
VDNVVDDTVEDRWTAGGRAVDAPPVTPRPAPTDPRNRLFDARGWGRPAGSRGFVNCGVEASSTIHSPYDFPYLNQTLETESEITS